MGSFFPAIRDAYNRHDREKAQEIVAHEIARVASPGNAIIYLDGNACQEKQHTHQVREDRRLKAMESASKELEALEMRNSTQQCVRKQHFLSVNKRIVKAFIWSLEDRHSLAIYLREQGWRVQVCEYEADTQIGKDCTPDDVVFSKDSDILMYDNITTVWRPITRWRCFVYDIPAMAQALGVTRPQLTALGCVSRNDYNDNVHTLGCSKNHSIVKRLTGE
ncbi:hypothetical protein EDD11_009699, partial [Mortierella claussenii]